MLRRDKHLIVATYHDHVSSRSRNPADLASSEFIPSPTQVPRPVPAGDLSSHRPHHQLNPYAHYHARPARRRLGEATGVRD